MGAPDDPAELRREVQALRRAQRLVEADILLTTGTARWPDDPVLAFFRAQTRYELGHPAAALFARAETLDPGNPEAGRNRALALVSEGEAEAAEALLLARLARQPDWLDGLRALATLRWTRGDSATFAQGHAAACRAAPARADLWLAWFRMLAQARDWAGASAVLDEAERHLGRGPAIMACRLFVAVESHDDAAAPDLLRQAADIRGDVTSLCRGRHALRLG